VLEQCTKEPSGCPDVHASDRTSGPPTLQRGHPLHPSAPSFPAPRAAAVPMFVAKHLVPNVSALRPSTGRTDGHSRCERSFDPMAGRCAGDLEQAPHRDAAPGLDQASRCSRRRTVTPSRAGEAHSRARAAGNRTGILRTTKPSIGMRLSSPGRDRENDPSSRPLVLRSAQAAFRAASNPDRPGAHPHRRQTPPQERARERTPRLGLGHVLLYEMPGTAVRSRGSSARTSRCRSGRRAPPMSAEPPHPAECQGDVSSVSGEP
jgi:hypothetical protein